MPFVSEIVKCANVSNSTVSLALNDKLGVFQRTLQHVLPGANQLNSAEISTLNPTPFSQIQAELYHYLTSFYETSHASLRECASYKPSKGEYMQ